MLANLTLKTKLGSTLNEQSKTITEMQEQQCKGVGTPSASASSTTPAEDEKAEKKAAAKLNKDAEKGEKKAAAKLDKEAQNEERNDIIRNLCENLGQSSNVSVEVTA